MIKCDVDGCDWEGYKIGLHKSLKHGITRKSQVHFDALINTIKESEDSLTVEEIGRIFNLLKTILKKRYSLNVQQVIGFSCWMMTITSFSLFADSDVSITVIIGEIDRKYLNVI